MFTNSLINFYSDVHNFIFPVHFIFHLIFIFIHTPSWHFFFFFRLIGCRANKSQGQVQRSHYIPLVLKFYVLISIYFRATFMEIWNLFEYIYLFLVFQTFWYFFYFVQFVCSEMLASRLWKNLLFLTHWLPSFEYHFNSLLLMFLLEPVLRFLALLSRVLRKPVIWISSQFNWLVATWCRIFVWEISEQITKSFISFPFLFNCPLFPYITLAGIF